MEWTIPLSDIDLDGEEIEAVTFQTARQHCI
ncbi:MAG: hypothetical protein DDT40_01864 [candidate division WS2 bacterium]|nr:hypothetical protein [Candidatus Psychracetigena formicireducens]